MANLSGPIWIEAEDTTVVSAVKQYPLGAKALGTDGNEYRYVQGIADGIASAVVAIDEAGLCALMVSGVIGIVGVMCAALVASKYGWAMTKGSMKVVTNGDVADNGLGNITSTPGAVDDASTTRISGLVFRAAGTGATTVLAQLAGSTFGM